MNTFKIYLSIRIQSKFKEVCLQTILLVFLFCFKGFGQNNVDMPNKPFGSAGNCIGKSLVVNCFISEIGNKWNTAEKDSILQKEQLGFNWLYKQSTNWGNKNLSFQVLNLAKDDDIVLAMIPKSSRSKIWITEYALHATGYDDVYALYDSLKKKYQVEHLVFMFFANKTGHSFAQSSTDTVVKFNREYYVEGAIVYRNYLDNNGQLCTGTIIHELLHLYGAWDMYKRVDNNVLIDENISRGFQKSIMLNDRRNDLTKEIIDPLTAWRLGWSKNYSPWFEAFRRERYK